MNQVLSSTVLQHLKRLSSHSAIYGIMGASSGLVSMMLIPLYGHVFTPATFGQLQIVQLWISIGATVAGLGLTTAYFKLFHEYPSESDRQGTLGIVWILSACSVSVVCIIFCVLSFQNLTDHFALLQDPVLLGLLVTSVMTGVLIGIPFQMLRAKERSLDYLKLGCMGLGAVLALNIVLVWWLEGGVKGVLAAQAISSLMMLALALPFIIRHTQIAFAPTRAKIMLRFGLPLVPASLALWVLEGSDRIFLERLWGVSEVGIYSLAYKYGIILQMTLGAFQTAWAPYLFSIAKDEAAPQIISRILTYFFAGTMILATLLYALRKQALSLAANSDFAGAESVVGPLLLGSLFYGFYIVAISGSYIHGKTLSVAIVVSLTAILNMILNFFFIPTFGGSGAAWATAISYLGLGGVMYWLSQVHFPMSLEWVPLSGAAFCCMSVAFLTDHLSLPGWGVWIVPISLVGLIPVVLWYGGFVSVSERQHIRDYMHEFKFAGDMP